jgi:hypothetical protein
MTNDKFPIYSDPSHLTLKGVDFFNKQIWTSAKYYKPSFTRFPSMNSNISNPAHLVMLLRFNSLNLICGHIDRYLDCLSELLSLCLLDRTCFP